MGKTIIKRSRDTSTQLTRDLTCRRFETRHRNPSVTQLVGSIGAAWPDSSSGVLTRAGRSRSSSEEIANAEGAAEEWEPLGGCHNQLTQRMGGLQPDTRQRTRCMGQHSAEMQSPAAHLLQSLPLSCAQPRREVLQQDQALPTHRNSLRQTRGQLPGVRPAGINPPLAARL